MDIIRECYLTVDHLGMHRKVKKSDSLVHYFLNLTTHAVRVLVIFNYCSILVAIGFVYKKLYIYRQVFSDTVLF